MTKRKYRGGATQHPLFRRWTHIRQCLNSQKYRHLDTDWDNFWDFADDIESHLGLPPKPEYKLHRRDQSLGWTLKNLCWETHINVAQKQRTAHRIKYRGKTQCLSAWSRELGISYFTLLRRYHRAWPNRLLFKQP